jgi:glycosyltransferase involved in cell wall biosynthesis
LKDVLPPQPRDEGIKGASNARGLATVVEDSASPPHSSVRSQEPLHPIASVIVLAHDRRQYLLEAVGSLETQDLPRSQFEIIVVKAFADPTIDAYLARVGADSILLPGTTAAAKVVAGVRHSRGGIILVLDDDDLFEPPRLRAVVNAFRMNPRLGFFCNQLTSIGPDGHPLDPRGVHGLASYRWGAKNQLLIEDPPKHEALAQLASWRPDFNAGSGAVRRELVERTMPYLVQLRSTVDTLFFFAALCSEYSVLLDPRRLTRYRIHRDSMTRAGTGTPEMRLRRLVDVARQTEADYQIIRELVARSDHPYALRLIDARIAVNRLTRASREPSSGRRAFTRLLPDLLRYADTYPVREDFLGVLSTVLFILSPSMGRAIYQRHVHVR